LVFGFFFSSHSHAGDGVLHGHHGVHTTGKGELNRPANLAAEFKIRPNERVQEIDGKKVLLIEVRIPQGASFFSDTGSRTAEEHMRKQLAPFRDRRRAAEETGLFDRVELVSP